MLQVDLEDNNMSEIQKQELTKKLLEIAKKEIGITYRTSLSGTKTWYGRCA